MSALSDLHAVFGEQKERGTVLLDPGTLNDPHVIRLFGHVLGQDTITVEAPEIGTPGDGGRFGVTGRAVLLGGEAMDISITFREAAGSIAVEIDLKAPATWQLSKGFPSLAQTGSDDLRFHAIRLRLVTHDEAGDRVPPRAALTIEAETTMAAMLGDPDGSPENTAAVMLTGSLEHVRPTPTDTVPGPSEKPLTDPEARLRMDLRGPLGASLLPWQTGNPSIGIEGPFIAVNDPSPALRRRIATQLMIGQRRIDASGTLDTDGSMTIEVAPQDLGLSDLANLVPGIDLDLAASVGKLPIPIPVPGMDRIEVGYHLKRKEFTHVMIATSIGETFPVPGGSMVLANPRAELSAGFLGGSAPAINVGVSGEVGIGGTMATARLFMPGMVLQVETENLALSDFLKDLAPEDSSLVSAMPDSVLRRAGLSIGLAGSTDVLNAGLSVALHLELDSLFEAGAISLTDFTVDLDFAGPADAFARATATLLLSAEGFPDTTIALDGRMDAHGWQLGGDVQFGDDGLKAGALGRALAGGSDGPDLPPVIAEAALTHIAAEVDTHAGRFAFDCTIDWHHDAELVVHFEKTGDHLLATGSLTLHGVLFRLAFERGGGQVLVGTLDAAGHLRLTLDDMLSALSSDATAALGPEGTGIALDIRSLAVAMDDGHRILLAAEVDAGIDLSRLGDVPLLGSMIPTDEPFGLKIAPVYMASGFTAAARVDPLLPEGLGLPDDLVAGMQVSATLHLGGAPISLDSFDLGTGPAAAAAPVLPTDDTPVATSPPLTAGTDVSWKDIDRAFGPLRIARVGYALDGSEIDLEIDASLSIASLEVSVMGFGARYDFEARSLTPRLLGMGLEMSTGPVRIGGAFMNLDGDFAGQVVIGTAPFSLSAIGAFRMLDGTPSMFVFGALDMPLGGPPFFFVDGLAAGLGLHRELTAPKVEDVRRFPLVASARAAARGEAEDMDAGTQIARLHDYILPKLGHHFLAAGIKFNSFRLLDGHVVAIVAFGERTEIDLIGTADFSSPPDLPEGVPALVKIELDILARLLPEEGRLTVEARLSSHSYVYGPPCHLSGGFAFYAWMTGGRAGDFVLSLGGYHPDFDPPAGYPTVPRLEMKYQLTEDIYLKGNAYFALTPSTMMAGGTLHLHAEIDALTAWADLSVDFLIAWEPFHYDAHVHLEIGARWKCFHTTASADLHIWGPPFSGTASVDWCVFSFDVSFGRSLPTGPVPISIDKFKSSFLQLEAGRPAADLFGIVPTAGVHGEVAKRPIMKPAEMRIGLSTRIPVRSARALRRDIEVIAARIGVAPANVADIGASNVTITVLSESDGSDMTGHFEVVATASGVPPALWGQSIEVDPNARSFMATTGFELRPATPAVAGATHPFVAQTLWEKEIVRWNNDIVKMATHLVRPGDSQAHESSLVVDLTKLGLDPSGLVAA